MTECFNPEVRDHLPDLVHGRLGELDTATMLAHIEACDACGREVALLRELRRDAPMAPAIDVARVVAALPPAPAAPRIEAPSRATSRSGLWKLLSAAAVVAIVSVAGLKVADRVNTTMPGATPEPATAEANSTSVTASTSGTPLAFTASVQDLTDEQVEQLLGELDGIDTIPSAEPEPAAARLAEDLGGGQ